MSRIKKAKNVENDQSDNKRFAEAQLRTNDLLVKAFAECLHDKIFFLNTFIDFIYFFKEYSLK